MLYLILTTLAERRWAAGRIETFCVVIDHRDTEGLDDAANGQKAWAGYQINARI
jgi:hypothetical protein